MSIGENDRIREVEARGVPEANFGNVQPEAASGEPVAWGLMLPSGKFHTFAASREGLLYWEHMPDFTIVPLYTHPSAAGVTVTEAMVEAAFVRLYPGCFPEEMQRYHADDIRAAITAALTAAREVQPHE